MDVRPLTEDEVRAITDRLAEVDRWLAEERERQAKLWRCNCPDFCVYHTRIGPC